MSSLDKHPEGSTCLAWPRPIDPNVKVDIRRVINAGQMVKSNGSSCVEVKRGKEVKVICYDFRVDFWTERVSAQNVFRKHPKPKPLSWQKSSPQ